ncbi:fibronectin type III domain-containing protein [bacterium]|nr:fibronectin type III domain-containing protein [bacterium]
MNINKPFTFTRFFLVFIFLASLFLPSSAFAIVVAKYVSSSGIIVSSNINGLAKAMRVTSDGSIYVLGTSTSTFLKVTSDLSTVSSVSYDQAPSTHASSDFIIDGSSFYIAISNSNFKLYKYTVSGNAATYVAEAAATSGTTSVTLGSDGYVYNNRGATANRYNPDLTSVGTTYKFVATPIRMAVDGSSLYYVSTTGTLRKVTDYTTGSVGVNGSTDISLATSLNSGGSPNGLAVSSGGYSYVSSPSRVYKVSPAGSTLWALTTANVVTMGFNQSTGEVSTIDNSGTARTYSPISAPTTFTASSIASTSLTLNWTVDSNASGSDFAGATIRSSTSSYPTSATDGSAVTSSNTDTSFDVTGLSAGTTYYYTIFNKTADGFSSAGVQLSVATAPAAPSISASKPALDSSTINLSWDVPTGTDHFILKRNDGTSDVNINTNIDDAITSYSDTGLSDGTYTYKIYAVNSNGDSSGVGTSSALTIDTTAPSAPNLTANKATLNGNIINLTWDTPSGTNTFTLQRSTDGGGYVNVQTGIASSTTTYNDTSLSDGTYAYKIFSVDAYGNISNAGTSSTLTIDTTAPSAPSITAELNLPNGNTINLTWNVPSGTSTFTLKRSVDAGVETTVASSIPNSTTSYQQTGLADGGYEYTLYAVDAYGNTSSAGYSSVLLVDTTPPSAPTSVAAEVSDDGTVTLTWVNPVSDFDSITILRDTTAFPANLDEGDLVAQNLTVTTYDDEDLEHGTYYYSLFALDTVGNVSLAANVTVVYEGTTPTVVTDEAVDVDDSSALLAGTITDAGTSDIATRGFEFGTTTDYGDSVEETGAFGAEEFELAAEDLDCGTTYHYRAFATNETGTAYGEDITFATSSCSGSSLEITIESPSSIVVNKQAVFVVTITNTADSDSTDTTIEFTLSDSLEFVSAEVEISDASVNAAVSRSTTPVTCTGTNPVVCNIGTIPAGQSATLNVTTRVVSTGTVTFGARSEGDDEGDGGTIITGSAADADFVSGCRLNPAAQFSKSLFVFVGMFLLFLYARRLYS